MAWDWDESSERKYTDGYIRLCGMIKEPEKMLALLVPVSPGGCHVPLQQVGGGVSDDHGGDHVDVLGDLFKPFQVGNSYLLPGPKGVLDDTDWGFTGAMLQKYAPGLHQLPLAGPAAGVV